MGRTITPFCTRFNNYKGGTRKVSKVYVCEEEFYCYFNSEGHSGREDWKITFIDMAKNIIELKRRGSYWQHRRDASFPNGFE